MLYNVIHFLLLAAPPRRDHLEDRIFVEKIFEHVMQESHETGVFQDAAAQRIGYRYISLSHHFQQTWNAQVGIFSKLQWVTIIIIYPAEYNVNFFKTFYGFDPNKTIARNQIISLYEGEAHIRSEEGMFKIRFITRTGSQ